jgi:WhiB family transcriptional regulator, redox-sensing transcriptional regulator
MREGVSSHSPSSAPPASSSPRFARIVFANRETTTRQSGANRTSAKSNGMSADRNAPSRGHRQERLESRAACAGVDPEVFLPDRGESLDEPRAYCRRCPVQYECLDAPLALGSQAIGVWGGTSARDRLLARRRGLTAAELLAEIRR